LTVRAGDDAAAADRLLVQAVAHADRPRDAAALHLDALEVGAAPPARRLKTGSRVFFNFFFRARLK
jgi:hypothetical protein